MISRTVAGRYAQALFDAARERKLTQAIDGELAAVGGELADNADFRLLFTGRALSTTEKKDLITAVFGNCAERLTLNFLCLLVDKERENWLPDIIDVYHQLCIDEQGILQARLVTPRPAGAEFQAELARLLEEDYGKKLEFTCSTDPKLLGGAVVKIRDQVIDLSLKKQFQMIREEMLK